MNELSKKCRYGLGSRDILLATVSGLAMLGSMGLAQASNSESDSPPVWIELGGAFAELGNGREIYSPPFASSSDRLPFITTGPDDVERGPTSSWDGNARIQLNLPGSSWSISAGVIYGRATREKTSKQFTSAGTKYNQQHVAYQSIGSNVDQSHLLIDFKVGRDVGLGLFARDVPSSVNFGIRYAQLNIGRASDLLYQPTNNIKAYHKFSGSFQARGRFIGIGPSLSWEGSEGLTRDDRAGQIAIDWGISGALLFGRQHLAGQHQTSDLSVPYAGGPSNYFVYQTGNNLGRRRSVIVPNAGGHLGISWRYPNAKISFGYKADFFFGSIDGGIDARKSETVGFYGPFAAISIGLGG